MSTYPRWSKKKDQWNRVLEAISDRVSSADYDEVTNDMGQANLYERLSLVELEWLEAFLCSFASGVRRSSKE